LFPVYAHSTAFAKPTPDGGWWLPLIEKAFAKVHVNYEMISSGTHAEAARFLTGSPAQEFTSNVQSSEEIWGNVKLAMEKNYMITAQCFIDYKGLVAGHGYIVQGITQLNGVNLIKMRNPFLIVSGSSLAETNSNNADWTGEYSIGSSVWTEANK